MYVCMYVLYVMYVMLCYVMLCYVCTYVCRYLNIHTSTLHGISNIPASWDCMHALHSSRPQPTRKKLRTSRALDGWSILATFMIYGYGSKLDTPEMERLTQQNAQIWSHIWVAVPVVNQYTGSARLKCTCTSFSMWRSGVFFQLPWSISGDSSKRALSLSLSLWFSFLLHNIHPKSAFNMQKCGLNRSRILEFNQTTPADWSFEEYEMGFSLLNCVSGVCSDLEIQQVVEQFSYMSKMYFLVFLYSWILFLIVYP